MPPGLSVWRFVRGLDPQAAQYSPLRVPLRIRSGAARLCRNGSAGWAAAYQRTHSALLRSKPRIGHHLATTRVRRRPRHRWCFFAKASRKQTSKQTNQQANKSANKQPNKQTSTSTNKHTNKHTHKQTHAQTNTATNKPTNKNRRTEQRVRGSSCEQMCAGSAQQERCSVEQMLPETAGTMQHTRYECPSASRALKRRSSSTYEASGCASVTSASSAFSAALQSTAICASCKPTLLCSDGCGAAAVHSECVLRQL